MKTSVNIKMDSDIRDRAKNLFAEMGLDMTTAVNMFLITSIREQRIPFEITATAKNDDVNIEDFFAQKLRNAEKQERSGQMRDFDDYAKEVELKYGFKV